MRAALVGAKATSWINGPRRENVYSETQREGVLV